MDFDGYYRNTFRYDLQAYINDIPYERRFHNADYHGIGYTTPVIQLGDVKLEANHIRLINEANRVDFALSLFHTVFVDQFFYTYYREDYQEFRKITLYPKLIGNCCSGCWHNANPKFCLHLLLTPWQTIEAKEMFSFTLSVMKNEILDFIQKYFPHIDVRIFWIYYITEVNEENLFVRESWYDNVRCC